MKIPLHPPLVPDIVQRVLESGGIGRYRDLLGAGIGPAPQGKYRHWDTLRQIEPKEPFTPEEMWLAVKSARQQLYRPMPLTDVAGRPFQYALPNVALEMLHRIDRDASGNIQASEQITNPQTRDTYLIKSLIEEAITSSQLEGAATTRRVAKQMIQEGRQPRNRGERMIHNNYQAMLHIRRFLAEPLTPEIVLELQRILTEGTLDDPDAAGRLRRSDDDDVRVVDEIGTVLHVPPPASELDERLRRLCAFANGVDSSGEFTHPAVRAIVLHLWLAYDHPFVDGNGRTARALFYWSMATQGYWLCEYISISRILRRARGQYARAFLYTETDENDATYFLLYQMNVILRAIRELHEYLARKAAEIRETERILEQSAAVSDEINHRQLALLNHALKNVGMAYTIASHRRAHHVSYQTARTDLLKLAALGLIEQRKRGRSFRFVAPPDLRRRIEQLGPESET